MLFHIDDVLNFPIDNEFSNDYMICKGCIVRYSLYKIFMLMDSLDCVIFEPYNSKFDYNNLSKLIIWYIR